jgi:hypothetical protein
MGVGRANLSVPGTSGGPSSAAQLPSQQMFLGYCEMSRQFVDGLSR